MRNVEHVAAADSERPNNWNCAFLLLRSIAAASPQDFRRLERVRTCRREPLSLIGSIYPSVSAAALQRYPRQLFIAMCGNRGLHGHTPPPRPRRPRIGGGPEVGTIGSGRSSRHRKSLNLERSGAGALPSDRKRMAKAKPAHRAARRPCRCPHASTRMSAATSWRLSSSVGMFVFCSLQRQRPSGNVSRQDSRFWLGQQRATVAGTIGSRRLSRRRNSLNSGGGGRRRALPFGSGNVWLRRSPPHCATSAGQDARLREIRAGKLISIRGAREHNLKNIDLDLPRDSLIVMTGLSGSGKSSLAFDTIYAEGQRRYVESLSAYARQFLEMMQKPDVDQIDGLSPAISIEQKTTSQNPRSTVGTVTEIYDYMRLLFARVGIPYSPATGLPIESQTVSADGRPHPGAAGGHAALSARAGRARPQGRIPQGPRRVSEEGLSARQDRRQVLRDRRGPCPRQEAEARHRHRGRPRRRAPRHRARASRIRWRRR